MPLSPDFVFSQATFHMMKPEEYKVCPARTLTDIVESPNKVGVDSTQGGGLDSGIRPVLAHAYASGIHRWMSLEGMLTTMSIWIGPLTASPREATHSPSPQ